MGSVFLPDSDPCYGCQTYYYGGDFCHYAVHNNESEGLCPCTFCIVKSMCDNDCDPFSKWTDTEGPEEALQKALGIKKEV